MRAPSPCGVRSSPRDRTPVHPTGGAQFRVSGGYEAPLAGGSEGRCKMRLATERASARPGRHCRLGLSGLRPDVVRAARLVVDLVRAARDVGLGKQLADEVELARA